MNFKSKERTQEPQWIFPRTNVLLITLAMGSKWV